MLVKVLSHGALRKIFQNCCIHSSQLPTPRVANSTATAAINRQLHGSNWQRPNAFDDQTRKIIPKLVYLHNPWKYIVTKFNMWKLKWLWDYTFSEPDFVEGSKQAAIVMTDIIRQQSAEKIGEFTTPVGFQQITRDMLLSRDDSRLQLVRFDREHLRRAIPMRVATRQNYGRKYAFIDMLFVGLRNTKDFDSPSELMEINDILRRMDNELKTPTGVTSVPHRIVFAEIFIRFRRDYTALWRRKEIAKAHRFGKADSSALLHPHQHANLSSELRATSQLAQPSIHNTTAMPSDGAAAAIMMEKILSRINDPSWSVSFYKILTFDVLNFNPHPKQR